MRNVIECHHCGKMTAKFINGEAHFECPECEDLLTVISIDIDDIVDALASVNRYFIDLQNKCLLTPKEEKIWAKISKAMNSV